MNENMLRQLTLCTDVTIPYVEESYYAEAMRDVVEPKLAELRMEK